MNCFTSPDGASSPLPGGERCCAGAPAGLLHVTEKTAMPRMHKLPLVVSLAAGLTALAAPAAAQTAADYPTRPIRIIAPFGAGGPGDVFSRQLAQYLPELLKQSVVVENRAGAASVIGAD